MPDLKDIDGERQRWLKLSGPLAGGELFLKYASPREGEKFRRRLQNLGILRPTKDGGQEIAQGRDGDYLIEFCKFYVLDWRQITINGVAEPYTPERLANILAQVGSALREVTEATAREEGFFENGEPAQI